MFILGLGLTFVARNNCHANGYRCYSLVNGFGQDAINIIHVCIDIVTGSNLFTF